MSQLYKVTTVIIPFFLLLPLFSKSQNPVIQTIYTADPAPMVYNSTLYLYTGHDEDKSTWFRMNDWKCFSTTDMVNWTDHGSPLSVKSFSWAGKDAWAGQCIFRNGNFYWYVPVNQLNGKGMAIGVAVSKSPTGPFQDALGKPLVHSGGGDIDPTVFIDDDGQAYLYWGNPYLKYVKLNKDMTSYSGVTAISHDDYIKVRNVDFKKVAKTFQVNVASGSVANIEIRVDSLRGKLLGNCEIKNTGGMQNWMTVFSKVDHIEGLHDLYFVFKGGKGDLFNFNWWKFN